MGHTHVTHANTPFSRVGFSSNLLIVALLALGMLYAATGDVFAQEESKPPKEYRNSTGNWFGLYTKYKLFKQWSYYGEYHVRRRNGMQDMGQVYLRFGLSHQFSNHSEVTIGFVNPYYWAPDQDAANIDKVVPQYRLWQQMVFSTPFDRLIAYHQIRTEQRYKRDYVVGSPYKFTFRYRYKITAYYPLNKKQYVPGALFLSFYNEIFLQFGREVTYNHVEDNRAFLGLGLNINDQSSIQAGYMNTYRHDGSPTSFEIRHIFRLSYYHHFDFWEKNHGKEIIHAH